jgi:hypothetical protein
MDKREHEALVAAMIELRALRGRWVSRGQRRVAVTRRDFKALGKVRK